MSDLKERERISDEEVKDMNEHEYVEHKPYTGPGCAICGRPRYVHDMARELRELLAQLAEAQEQLSDREKAQDILVLAVKANGREALVAGQKAEELRAERDKLVGALDKLIEAQEHTGYEEQCPRCQATNAARAVLRELERNK